MSGPERRKTERLLLTIPIRVMAFGNKSGGEFTEDARTVEVTRAGARIALKHRVAPDQFLRIINLENLREGDFRVVGETRSESAGTAEWGVESLEQGRDIWGIEFPKPLVSEEGQAGALLECRRCCKQSLSVLSLMQVDILDSTGRLDMLCDQCGQLSSWTYADVTRRPKEPPATEQAAPPPEVAEWDKQSERRVHKRLGLKMPVFVRNEKGEEEVSKTENVSKGGLGVCLAMKLAVGETVRVVCPYSEGGQKVEQKAEVRRRSPFKVWEKWLYGFRYVP